VRLVQKDASLKGQPIAVTVAAPLHKLIEARAAARPLLVRDQRGVSGEDDALFEVVGDAAVAKVSDES